AASLKRATTAVRVFARSRTERGARLMKPSVSFSQKERSTDESCPLASVAETTQRQRPSGWSVARRFFEAVGQVNVYVPGCRATVSEKPVTPPGPSRLAVTVEGRTTLYATCCCSATPSPFGETTGSDGGGAYTPV